MTMTSSGDVIETPRARREPIVANPDWTDALEQLLTRRYSCRAFRPDAVAPQTIHRILALAQRTASWCNAQPWKLVVTSGAATERFRQALVEHVQQGRTEVTDYEWPREYRGDYQVRRRECGLALYEAAGVAKGDRVGAARQGMENFRFFGAPHVAIVTTEEPLGLYGAVDCGAYVQNFMLAACSVGVASIAQAALAKQPDFVRRFFGLPAERRVICGISFGFEDAQQPVNRFRTTRAAWQDEVTLLDN